MPDRELKIEVRVAAPMRTWHEKLAAILRSDGHRLRLVATDERAHAPSGFETLMALQRRIFRAQSSAFGVIAGNGVNDFDGKADLVLLLAGASGHGDSLCLVPQFDGAAGEDGLIKALLAGRAPVLSLALIQSGAAPRIVAHALPAIEDPLVLARSLDQFIARLTALLRRTIRQIAADETLAADTTPPVPLQARKRSAAGFFLAGFNHKIGARLRRLKQRDNHWFIGWRNLSGDGVAHDLAWPPSAYEIIDDDKQRYFADPFPFAHEGRSYIFCEEFPYATQKGVISVFERMSDGRFGPAQTVLERPYHLSYPQIIARDSAIFMLPETGAAGRIELYRATRFPDAWELVATLVDNVMASDATWVEYGGRHWLFASVAGDGGSTWDQLFIYYAPDLLGPWTPHAGNPVLIDAGTARPAGDMWLRDGALWRSAQDCRQSYGGGLAICRIDVLTQERFAQTVVARLAPPLAQTTGVHTLNNAAGIEVIDWRAPRRR